MKNIMGTGSTHEIIMPIVRMAIFVAGAAALCSVIMINLALLFLGSGADHLLQSTQGVGI